MHLAMTLTYKGVVQCTTSRRKRNTRNKAYKIVKCIYNNFIVLWWRRSDEIHQKLETSINGDYTLLMYRPYHVLCPLQERDDGGDLVLHRQQTTALDLDRLQLELRGSHVFTTGSQVRPKALDFLKIKIIL